MIGSERIGYSNDMITRRNAIAVSLAAAAVGRATDAAASPRMGAPFPMSFDALVAEARAASNKPFEKRPEAPASILDAIDYERHNELRTPFSKAMYRNGGHPVTFFHLGQFFRRPVRIHAWDGRSAREVIYVKELFDPPAGNPAERMPEGAGFAGFRVHEATADPAAETGPDWLAFLGASYFRTCGDAGQYGISARGVAVDTAPSTGSEDFPDFTRFYVGPYEGSSMEVLAFLDGESVVGAYRIVATRRPRIVTTVECTLFPRRRMERFGVAPLTSMYWFSETNKSISPDTRHEVHDSDGLAMLTGAGERLWRPLNNPPRVVVSSFSDRSPRGFGLLQRDRAFDHYSDEAAYERRPNLWVEPLGDWGRGSVQLVEIPTPRETDDNVVAMWVPERPVEPGEEHRFSYRLRWCVDEPLSADLARCVATRMDKGTRPAGPDGPVERVFVIEMGGRALDGLDAKSAERVVSASRGKLTDMGSWPYGNGDASPWRVFFKVLTEGPDPVEIRLSLRHGGREISETVLIQYHPEQIVER